MTHSFGTDTHQRAPRVVCPFSIAPDRRAGIALYGLRLPAHQLAQLVQACEPGAFGDQEPVAIHGNRVVAARVGQASDLRSERTHCVTETPRRASVRPPQVQRFARPESPGGSARHVPGPRRGFALGTFHVSLALAAILIGVVSVAMSLIGVGIAIASGIV